MCVFRCQVSLPVKQPSWLISEGGPSPTHISGDKEHLSKTHTHTHQKKSMRWESKVKHCARCFLWTKFHGGAGPVPGFRSRLIPTKQGCRGRQNFPSSPPCLCTFHSWSSTISRVERKRPNLAFLFDKQQQSYRSARMFADAGAWEL